MKKMYILLPLAIMLFMVGSVFAFTEISTCQELQDINNDITGDYVLINDIDCSDTINWNSGMGFNPIGSSSSQFTGSFDGQNHKIIGLYIDRPRTNDVGLFAITGVNANIKNVILEDADITGGHYDIGGIVGWAKGKLVNVHVKGIVRGDFYVGLLAGVADNDVIDCSTNGQVISKGGGHFTSYAGGLIGYMNYDGFGSVYNSHSDVDVICHALYCGGLVGYKKAGHIFTSSAVGRVHDGGLQNEVHYFGGLVGSNNAGNIVKSYAGVNVIGFFRIGGLVGENSRSGRIVNSYSIGRVDGMDTVGGLVGFNVGEILNSFSIGRVNVGPTGDYSGGLVGYNTGDVIDSYYNTETSGQNDVGKGIPKITFDMMQESTFVDWDFEDVWEMCDTVSTPVLQWQEYYITPLVCENCYYDFDLGYWTGCVGCNIFHQPPARDGCTQLHVTATNNQVLDTSNRPQSVRYPIAGKTVYLYGKECQTGQWTECTPLQSKVTDADGKCTFNVDDGMYTLVLDYGDGIYVSDVGVPVRCHRESESKLYLITGPRGEVMPAKAQKITGSLLEIIEPEYVVWSGIEEFYPFVFIAEGDWEIDTSIVAPEGYEPDVPSIVTLVANEAKTIMFRVIEVGSIPDNVDVTHRIDHNGKSQVIRSKVGMKMTPALEKAKAAEVSRGLEASQGRAQGVPITGRAVETIASVTIIAQTVIAIIAITIVSIVALKTIKKSSELKKKDFIKSLKNCFKKK